MPCTEPRYRPVRRTLDKEGRCNNLVQVLAADEPIFPMCCAATQYMLL